MTHYTDTIASEVTIVVARQLMKQEQAPQITGHAMIAYGHSVQCKCESNPTTC
jgi:hypothetical protein